MVGKSEDVLGETFDRCLADTALKTLGAGAIGVLAAVMLKRQSPLLISIGFGLGMGVANCRHEMRRPFVGSEGCTAARSKSNESEKSLRVVDETAKHSGPVAETH